MFKFIKRKANSKVKVTKSKFQGGISEYEWLSSKGLKDAAKVGFSQACLVPYNRPL